MYIGEQTPPAGFGLLAGQREINWQLQAQRFSPVSLQESGRHYTATGFGHALNE